MTAISAPQAASSSALSFAAVVVGTLVVCGAFVLAAGRNPIDAIAVLVGYTLGTRNGLLQVAVYTIPLTLAGLGVAVAFRANIFNIGADGQLIVGAILAVALTGLAAPPVSWLVLPAFLLFGLAGGAVYGGFAGWLRARYNANEIIVTIMLNYIALQLLGWVIRGPLQEGIGMFPRSDALPAAARLDILIAGSRVHEGLLVALAATVIVFVVMRYTSFGYQLLVTGANRQAARYGGIRDRRVIVAAMAVSGALCGLAGAVEIAGVHHRLQDNFAPGIGITAIAVALLARLSPAYVPLTAFLFGVLTVGSGALQRQIGIPFPLVWLIQGIVILAFLLLGALRARR